MSFVTEILMPGFLPRRFAPLLAILLLAPHGLRADDAGAASSPPGDGLAQRLAREARDSLVLITVNGRDSQQMQLGAGFIISADGLIATNAHVIGEGRPISVKLADERTFEATAVHAWDRHLDLAVIRVEADGLKPLALADSQDVQQGEPVVALGNPHGLRNSVVAGVVSGVREFDEQKMLQLAIPVEPGNSGGPVLDGRGRVVGVVTRKSAISDNLAFAVESNTLKTLLDKPNPVPIARWMTIGRLDPRRWKPLLGADWRQHAGRIQVAGAGAGFGGRSLCLWQEEPPELPFEIAVTVRLDDESGAAGLVFQSDGGDRHYGFYPSAGNLRLSRFEGPVVFTWQVLADVPSEHYRPGEWNRLKVRLEKGKILCYVNDHLAIESTDDELPRGKVGLAKFRDTKAEFKQFQVAKEIPQSALSAERLADIETMLDALPRLDEIGERDFAPLADAAAPAAQLLRDRAAELDEKAQELRRLAEDVHTQAIVTRLVDVLDGREDGGLARAALLVALLDDGEIDIESYLHTLDRMAGEIRQSLPEDSDEAARLAALTRYLFEENGFHGSRTNYYHRANSYLNQVIDDREGLPITLSLLFMELGRRLELKIEGVGLPGHFVVRHVPAEGEPQLIDVFEGGKPMPREKAEAQALASAGRPLTEDDLKAADERAIIVRMLGNLLGVAQEKDDKEAMLRYLEAIVAVRPDAAQERGLRAILRQQTGRRAAALADLDWFLENQPEGIDLDRIRQMREFFESEPRRVQRQVNDR
jgi:regulator of sirC expression with transglutaminase-like and TPR domain/S1-C subfamily serine protease